ncbi:MAG: hypothetical protein DSY47_04225, partial [Hydrogenothermus sp.]
MTFYILCNNCDIRIKRKELVIVAVDDINLQREIYNYCYRRKIPVNSVDSP